MENINIPIFNEKGERIDYITVNTKCIRCWSILKSDKTLSIKIELVDNTTFNRFYNYEDKSELNLLNVKLFEELVFSLNELASEEQFCFNYNASRSINESKPLGLAESKEKTRKHQEEHNILNKTLVAKPSNIQSGNFHCLTVIDSKFYHYLQNSIIHY